MKYWDIYAVLLFFSCSDRIKVSISFDIPVSRVDDFGHIDSVGASVPAL